MDKPQTFRIITVSETMLNVSYSIWVVYCLSEEKKHSKARYLPASQATSFNCVPQLLRNDPLTKFVASILAYTQVLEPGKSCPTYHISLDRNFFLTDETPELIKQSSNSFRPHCTICWASPWNALAELSNFEIRIHSW